MNDVHAMWNQVSEYLFFFVLFDGKRLQPRFKKGPEKNISFFLSASMKISVIGIQPLIDSSAIPDMKSTYPTYHQLVDEMQKFYYFSVIYHDFEFIFPMQIAS